MIKYLSGTLKRFKYSIQIFISGLVLVVHLSVSLEVLPNSHSLLDQVVQVLRQVRSQTLGLEDPQDLVAGDKTHLGHTMRVPQNHTCAQPQTFIFFI